MVYTTNMNYLTQSAPTADQLDKIGGSTGFKYTSTTIGQIVGDSLQYVFAFAGFALIIFIVLSGYSLMASKGDERAVAAAKAKLTYGITGFLIVFVSYWIVQIVGAILQIDIIKNTFK